MIYDIYDDKKFFTTEGDVTVFYDDLGFKRYKQNFHMTRDYIEYLKEKRAEEERFEIAALKSKLEYQKTHYGEVDLYDLAEYTRLVQASYINY